MNKVTVQSPSNIAFIKYWGYIDDELYIPHNNNISMTLSNCLTITTVERIKDGEDSIEVKFENSHFVPLDRNTIKGKKAYEQIDRIRNLAGSNDKVKIKSSNNFPADAGIASSASGFSALTAALVLAFDLKDTFADKKELSKLVRLSGSASAARSVYDGFVELNAGKNHEDSYAVQIVKKDHWDLVDLVVIVSQNKKTTSTSEGHQRTNENPYFQTRLTEMQNRINFVREAIQNKDLEKLGKYNEQDTISMHAVTMTSEPPIFYWDPETLTVMKEIMRLREKNNVLAYFTIDAGPNVHVICEKKDAITIQNKLEQMKEVQRIIYNEAGEGLKIINNHLF